MSIEEKVMERKSYLQIACFKMGKEIYGISINHIREVIKVPLEGIYAIPNVPDYVTGIYNLRGNVIPLINLNVRFKIPSIYITEEDKLLTGYLIVKIKDKLLGIFVDRVLKVINFDESKVQEPPATLQTLDRKYISGVVRIENDENFGSEYLILIDIERIFDKSEFEKIPYKDSDE
ncbi:Chemotaxis protein CheW [Borrelia miyamotoi]|uniref:Chemotaxis protein CheW n=1 Tax=Borrelia miyamotoi TaxID=47466 RepID=A0AAP8YUC3_9SPIR|nr:chemotaxis protein CheW [Borrelia miyamotoi]AHH05100.1 Chemotaxis protein cheW [Borrelia miyamotoi FR64b]ATQ14894.1 chemotaxis protein CheW [Borrelia miyamotoi]ATQ16076.1 chemotaxis protein CheW [Borrelia miyamotoi]ATQ17222.1 chemotaxis protein CheW [Borrelia miyamotoi]ATQ18272.1 chemotaxis protein CheW [Borrelia miyamotoi]